MIVIIDNLPASFPSATLEQMKKLFLASFVAYSIDKLIATFKLTPPTLTAAFIPTAADPYKKEDRGFVKEDRDGLTRKGFRVKDVDIKGKTKDELLDELKNIDIIFVGGGNVFYLLEKARESGFDQVVKGLVEKGVIYVGSSAGAVLACPDIEAVARLDDPSKAPSLKSTEGLGLVDFVVIPHHKNEKFSKGVEQILKECKGYKYKLIPIADQQAFVVKGNKYKIV